METTTESRLEALEQQLRAGQLAEIAIEDEQKRQRAAERAEAEREVQEQKATLHEARDGVAREWLAQAEKVSAALEALIEANHGLARIADRDDTLYRYLWQLSSGRPGPVLPGALDLPTLPETLSHQFGRLIATAEGLGVRERAARAES
jgi:hypothetical protein